MWQCVFSPFLANVPMLLPPDNTRKQRLFFRFFSRVGVGL